MVDLQGALDAEGAIVAYQTKDLYSTRHAAMIEILKDKGFASSDDWKSVIEGARRIVVSEGFDVDRYPACDGIRKRVDAAEKKGRTRRPRPC